MKISDFLTDDLVLAEIGERIASHRLDQQLTQAEVADQAGVSKRTLERIEAGASAQLSSLIRILRVLNLLPGLDLLLPEPEPRPMDLLQRKGKPRQRASKSKRPKQPAEPWTWNDEQ